MGSCTFGVILHSVVLLGLCGACWAFPILMVVWWLQEGLDVYLIRLGGYLSAFLLPCGAIAWVVCCRPRAAKVVPEPSTDSPERAQSFRDASYAWSLAVHNQDMPVQLQGVQHVAPHDVPLPSTTDDKRMLEAFFGCLDAWNKVVLNEDNPVQLQVVHVERVENETTRADYELYCAEKMRKCPRPPGSAREYVSSNWIVKLERYRALLRDRDLNVDIREHFLFYGTSAEVVEGITRPDFQLPKQHAHGGLYGMGIYLTESYIKAFMYAKESEQGFPLLIVRAALGNVKIVVEDRPNAYHLERGAQAGLYNSVCGDRRDLDPRYCYFAGWREFIVYNNAQVVPEWIVWVRPLA